jgi:phage-related tail fiber protein
MVVAEETTQYLTQDEVRYAKSQLVPSTDYTYSQVISSTTNEKYDNSSTTKTMTDQEISDLYADQQNKISSVSEIKVESSDETLQIKNVTVHKTDAEKTTRSAKGFVFAIDTDKQIIVFFDKEDHYKAFVSNDTIFTVDGKRFLFSSLEQGDIITVSGQSAVNSNEIQASTVILTGVFETPIVNNSEI